MLNLLQTNKKKKFATKIVLKCTREAHKTFTLVAEKSSVYLLLIIIIDTQANVQKSMFYYTEKIALTKRFPIIITLFLFRRRRRYSRSITSLALFETLCIVVSGSVIVCNADNSIFFFSSSPRSRARILCTSFGNDRLGNCHSLRRRRHIPISMTFFSRSHAI